MPYLGVGKCAAYELGFNDLFIKKNIQKLQQRGDRGNKRWSWMGYE